MRQGFGLFDEPRYRGADDATYPPANPTLLARSLQSPIHRTFPCRSDAGNQHGALQQQKNYLLAPCRSGQHHKMRCPQLPTEVTLE